MSDEIQTRAVDNSAWDGNRAMGMCSTAAQYASICAGEHSVGTPDQRQHWALPHHYPGEGPNADGVRNAISRLPQTEDLTNPEDAQRHLEAHMATIQARSEDEESPTIPIEASDIQVRDLAKRELDIKILPWNVTIDTASGLEEFRSGAFSDTKPESVLLHGLEHEAFLGLGQMGQPKLTRHPVGKATALFDRPDGQWGTFRVAKTARGDEVLALAVEGIVTGASAEWAPLPGGTLVETANGRRKSVHVRAQLRGVCTTYQPAYKEAGVVAVRSDQEGNAAMAEETAAVAAPKEPEAEVQSRALETFGNQLESMLTKVTEGFGQRIASLEERARSAFQLPTAEAPKPVIGMGEWSKVVFQLLTGDKIPAEYMRSVEDLITTDNSGVVPEQFVSELRGVIDPSRPFMESTRRLPTPSAGTTLRVPIITQRPTVAEQSTEKSDLSSQVTKIGSNTFEMVTKGGVGDLSLQLLKRSDPSFLDLYVRLLAEAYAIEADAEAVAALIDAIGNVQSADPLNPNNLSLGDAFGNSFDAIRRPPDTIWLSTAALVEFINAKATTTNQPLYSSITANATAGGGIRGTISGLNAVHVPALDAHGAFAIVGPSNGFAWAEDGTYTLQVDVPAKAGRDVALVGMLWFIPWYPDAFSLYNVASGS